MRGYGFLDDGNVDTVFRFVHRVSFSDPFNGPGSNSIPDGPEGKVERRQLEAFILAFPTNLVLAVGQQITLTAASSAALGCRITLLRQSADARECDLVAKTRIDDEAGFLYVGSGMFVTDRRGQPPLVDTALQSRATGFDHPVTYTCVPPGSGARMGVDRDGDGAWERSTQSPRFRKSIHL